MEPNSSPRKPNLTHTLKTTNIYPQTIIEYMYGPFNEERKWEKNENNNNRICIELA